MFIPIAPMKLHVTASRRELIFKALSSFVSSDQTILPLDECLRRLHRMKLEANSLEKSVSSAAGVDVEANPSESTTKSAGEIQQVLTSKIEGKSTSHSTIVTYCAS